MQKFSSMHKSIYTFCFSLIAALIRIGRNAHLDLAPVTLTLGRPQSLAVPNDGQKDAADGERDKSNADEAVLQPETIEPGRDTVGYGKAHGVADEDEGDEGIAGNLAKGIDEVGDGEGDADAAAEGENGHGDDETEPVNAVRGLCLLAACSCEDGYTDEDM